MVIYDVDSITASEVLLSKSAETGLTVAALAEQLVHDVSRLRPEHSGRLVDDVLFRTLQDRFDES